MDKLKLTTASLASVASSSISSEFEEFLTPTISIANHLVNDHDDDLDDQVVADPSTLAGQRHGALLKVKRTDTPPHSIQYSPEVGDIFRLVKKYDHCAVMLKTGSDGQHTVSWSFFFRSRFGRSVAVRKEVVDV